MEVKTIFSPPSVLANVHYKYTTPSFYLPHGHDEIDNKTNDQLQHWKDEYIMSTNYEREDERLKTFERWPLEWLDKNMLAQTGMYYTGDEDKVKCYFCEVEIGKWEPEDQVIGEHLRFSPHCPLLKRRTTNNVPLNAEELDRILPAVSYDICGTGRFSMGVSEGNIPAELLPSSTVNARVQTYKHAFPEYAIESSRLRSFDDWPLHMKQKPQQMAEAGFFYTGTGDRVKCFSCGGGLKDWDDNDDPWEEHALWLSNCEYVKLIKGQSYIDTLSAKKKESEQSTSTQAAAATTTAAASCSNNNKKSICKDNAGDLHASIPEDKLCKICYAQEYNTAFLPCGHVVACAKCASSVDKCPLCREPFTNVMRVYFS